MHNNHAWWGCCHVVCRLVECVRGVAMLLFGVMAGVRGVPLLLRLPSCRHVEPMCWMFALLLWTSDRLHWQRPLRQRKWIRLSAC